MRIVAAFGARLTLLFMLTLGILLPRAGAVLAEVIPGIYRVTICTGDAMITLTIGPDGQPIEETDVETPHCVMADGVAIASLPLPYWQSLALSDAPRPAVLDDPLARLASFSYLRPVRAPPFS